jgi:hypothetical protein
MEFQRAGRTDISNMIPEGLSVPEGASAYNCSEIAFSVDCYRTSDSSQAKFTLKVFPRAQAAGAVASDLAQRERLLLLKAKGPFVVKVSNDLFVTEHSICLALEKWDRNLYDVAKDSLAAPPQCTYSEAKLTKLALQRQVILKHKRLQHTYIYILSVQ